MAFNPMTYDYAANTGPVATNYPVTLGSVTLASAAQFNSGSGTAADPWVYDGHIIRNNPAKNPLGNPLATSETATLLINVNNVIIRNVFAPVIAIAGISVAPYGHSNITIDHCKTGLYDYQQSTAPTVDFYSGLPISNGANTFRQFWWNPITRVAWALPINGTSWVWAGEYWTYLMFATPTVNLQDGYTWCQVHDSRPTTASPPGSGPGTGYAAIGYYRYNAATSAWSDISGTIDGNVVGINDGGSLASCGSAPASQVAIRYCEIQGWEDGVYGGSYQPIDAAGNPNGPFRPAADHTFHYNWFRSGTFCRGKSDPHADHLQSVGVDHITIQRNRFDGDPATYGWYQYSGPEYNFFNPHHQRYNANIILKTDNGAISDVLISENWIRYQTACQTFRLGKSLYGPPTNLRVRNNVYAAGTTPILDYDSPSSGTPWSWSGNIDENGVSVATTSTRLGKSTTTSQTPVNDGDPSGEGLTLRNAAGNVTVTGAAALQTVSSLLVLPKLSRFVAVSLTATATLTATGSVASSNVFLTTASMLTATPLRTAAATAALASLATLSVSIATAGPPVTVVVASGATGASANTASLVITVINPVAVGVAVLVAATMRYLTTKPINPVVGDSRGNSYTLDAVGGNAVAELSQFHGNLSVALQTGDTITITYASAADEIVMVADSTPGYALSLSGAAPTPSSAASSVTHSKTITLPNATDFAWGADTESGATATGVAVTGQTNTASSPVNRGIVSFSANPGVTSPSAFVVTWPTAHVGSINVIPFLAAPISVGPSVNASAAMSATASLGVGVVSRTAYGAAAFAAAGTLSIVQSGSQTSAAALVTVASLKILTAQVFARTRAFLANRPGDLEGLPDPDVYDLIICNPSYASGLAALKIQYPSVTWLVYRNEIACPTGNSDALVSVSYVDANANHTDWFLLDQNGARLTFSDYPSNTWMNQGVVGYQNQWAANAITECQRDGWDGVFIDDHNSHYTAHLASGKTIPTYPTETSNRLASKAFATNVCAKLRTAGLYSVANTAFNFQTNWQQAFTDLGAAPDGNMREFWAYSTNVAGGIVFDTGNWDYQQAQMTHGLSLGRAFIPLTYVTTSIIRDYARASFLLLSPVDESSASMTSAITVGQDPGTPFDPGTPTTAKTAIVNNANCYTRVFTGGTIYVNADTIAHTLGGVAMAARTSRFVASANLASVALVSVSTLAASAVGTPPTGFNIRQFIFTSLGPQTAPPTHIVPGSAGLSLATLVNHSLQTTDVDTSIGSVFDPTTVSDGTVVGCTFDGGGVGAANQQPPVRKIAGNANFVDVNNCNIANSAVNGSDAHNLTSSSIRNAGYHSHAPRYGRQRPHVIDLVDLLGPVQPLVAGRISDCLRVDRDGYLTVTRTRLSGHNNSALYIQSDNQNSSGTGESIENVLIEDVLIDYSTRGSSIAPWNTTALVRQGASDPAVPSTPTNTYKDLHPLTYRRRPNYVTFRRVVLTNIPLAGGGGAHPPFPVITGYGGGDSAAFVASEVDRDRGVQNQVTNQAAAYSIRKARGFNDNALDARTWIVWEDCQFYDGTQIIPPAGFYDVYTYEPSSVIAGRVDVRTRDWNAVGRPTGLTDVAGPLNTNGISRQNLRVAGDIVVNTTTASVTNCEMDNGWLNIYTGRALDLAQTVYVTNPPANGIGNVTTVKDFRIDQIGNDGLLLSKGGPPGLDANGNPQSWTPVDYPDETLARDGVILHKGYLPAGSLAHADNIQLWSGKHYHYKGLWLGGVTPPVGSGTGRTNALFICKSDIQPWDGVGYPPRVGRTDDEIIDVVLEDVYLDMSVGNGVNEIICICEGNGPRQVGGVWQDSAVSYKKRPKYVTLRGLVVSNMPNGTKPTVANIFVTSVYSQTDYAVFVRTEAERAQGVVNQTANPAIINQRMAALSAARSGMIWPDMVDARSWIVMETDCVYQDGSPLIPQAGFYNVYAAEPSSISTVAASVALSAVSTLTASGSNAVTQSATVAMAGTATLITAPKSTLFTSVTLSAVTALIPMVSNLGAPASAQLVAYASLGVFPGTPTAISIAGGGSTATYNNTALTITVGTFVPVGSGVLAASTIRYLVTKPGVPTLTDSRGNTYTLDRIGGQTQAEVATFRSNIATALQVGDTMTVTYGSVCDEIVLAADAFIGYSLVPSGTVPTPLSAANSTVHTKGEAAPNAGDVTWGADVFSGGNVLVSVTGSTFLQTAASPVNRGLTTFFNNPNTTVNVDTSVTWTTTHTGSINNIPFIATRVVAAVQSASVALSAAATLNPLPIRTAMASVALGTVQSTVAAPARALPASLAMTSVSTLSVVASYVPVASANLVAVADLQPFANAKYNIGASLSAASVLTAVGARDQPASATLSAAAVLIATPAIQATATLVATSTLLAVPTAVYAASVALAAVETLTPNALREVFPAINLFGTATLAITATVLPIAKAIPIAGGGSTAAYNASAFSITVVTAVAARDAVMIASTVRYLGTAPATPVVTDSRGNTYTLLDSGGTTAAKLSVFYANLTTGLQVGDTITVTYTSGGAADQISLIADATIGYSLATHGTINTSASLASSTTHVRTVTPAGAADFMWGADVNTGGGASEYVSIAGALFVQCTGAPGRAIVSYYNNPGSTSAMTTTVTWSTARLGSMDTLAFTATPTTQRGEAYLTAVATLTATGTVDRAAAAALAAVATLTPSATRVYPASVGLSTVATLTAAPSLTQKTTAALSAVATLGITATREQPVALTLFSVSTLAVTATVLTLVNASAALSATETTTATGTRTTSSAASLSAVAALTITGVGTIPATAVLTASSTLAVVALRVAAPVAALTATAALTSIVLRTTFVAAALTASAVLSPVGVVVQGGAPTLSVTATLALTPTQTTFPSVAMAEAATLTLAPAPDRPGVAALAITATLTALAAPDRPAAVTFTATSVLDVDPTAIPQVHADTQMFAVSTLGINAVATIYVTPILTAVSDLTLGGLAIRLHAAALSATSTLAIAALRVVPAAAGLAVSSTLGITVFIEVLGALDLAAVSTLLSLPQRFTQNGVDLTAASSLDIAPLRVVLGFVDMVAAADLALSDLLVTSPGEIRLAALADLEIGVQSERYTAVNLLTSARLVAVGERFDTLAATIYTIRVLEPDINAQVI